MLQCSLLCSIFGPEAAVLVLTANGPELERVMPKLLPLVNVSTKDQARFVVAGCEKLPGFEAVALAQKVDVDKVQPHVVKLVQSMVAANPKIGAVLLECTELPPYADAIREATGLVVMDVITLVDYFPRRRLREPLLWHRLGQARRHARRRAGLVERVMRRPTRPPRVLPRSLSAGCWCISHARWHAPCGACCVWVI